MNELNLYIQSIPVQNIYYHCGNSSKKGILIKNVQYIDLGLEYFSFYVDDISIISIRYSVISHLNSNSTLTLKVIHLNQSIKVIIN